MAYRVLMCSGKHHLSAPLKSVAGVQRLIHSSGTHLEKKGFFAPDAAVDKTGKVNRWSMFAPAFVTHVCLGAPYGWSAISGTLAREYGFVVSSAGDWALSSCTYPMSVMVSFCY